MKWRAMGTGLAVLAIVLSQSACNDEVVDAVVPEEGTDSPNLPPGFEDAVQVDVTMGKSYYTTNETEKLAATLVDGKIRVLYTGLFPCEIYKQEAYVQQVENGYNVLFQNMVTEFHNACGEGMYDMRLFAGPGVTGDTVAVYTRMSEEDEPVKVAETQAEDTPVDCDNLTSCGADNPCENEGFMMDERSDDYTLVCASLPSCGGGFCVWDAEACLMECESLECELGDGYPLTPCSEDTDPGGSQVDGSFIDDCLPDLRDASMSEDDTSTYWSENSYSFVVSYSYCFDSPNETCFNISAYQAHGGPTQPGEYPVTEELVTGNPAPIEIELFERTAAPLSTRRFTPAPGSGTITITAIEYAADGAEFSGCLDLTLEESSFSETPCSGTFSYCWTGTAVYDPA